MKTKAFYKVQYFYKSKTSFKPKGFYLHTRLVLKNKTFSEINQSRAQNIAGAC